MGIASYASGQPVNAIHLISILFAVSLMAWTISQYSRQPRRLVTLQRFHLPARLGVQRLPPQVDRLAA